MKPLSEVEVRSLVLNIGVTRRLPCVTGRQTSDGLRLASRISHDGKTSKALPTTPHSCRIAYDQLTIMFEHLPVGVFRILNS